MMMSANSQKFISHFFRGKIKPVLPLEPAFCRWRITPGIHDAVIVLALKHAAGPTESPHQFDVLAPCYRRQPGFEEVQ
jgi:hypothetical protein